MITCVNTFKQRRPNTGINHVGKNRHGNLERILFKKGIKHSQDYADVLVLEFATETQSQNFGGNNYLSIEGVTLEYIKYDDRKRFTKKYS